MKKSPTPHSVTDYRDNLSRAMIYTACFFDFGAARIGAPLYISILIASIFSFNSYFPSIFKYFSPLLITTFVYALLSIAQVMPHSWTLFYLSAAIPNQTLWTIATPLIILGAYWYFANVYAKNANRELYVILALLIANTVLSGLVFKHRPFAYGYFGYLWAPLCTLLCALGYNAIRLGQKRAIFVAAIVIGACLLLSDSSQNKLTALLLAGFLLIRKQPRYVHWTAVAVTISLMAFGYYWAWNNPMAAYHLDPNFGIRAQFAKNALLAFQETNYLGVGFGTEGVKNVYPEVGVKSFQTINSHFVFIGNHNAFFDIMMRTGIPGIASLLYALYCFRPRGENRETYGYQSFLLCTIIVNLCVNVALQSAYHAVGVAITLGAIAAQNATYRKTRPAQVNAPKKAPQASPSPLLQPQRGQVS